MKYLLRPLTTKMIDQLIQAREMELSGDQDNFCFTHHFKHSMTGLYKRGLIDSKMELINGRKMLRVFITDSGINFLERYHAQPKN